MRVWVVALAMIACKKDPEGTSPPEGGEAFAFLPDAGPVEVDPALVGDDGLIRNRLVVRLGAGADADDLDAALAEVDGTVASARPGLPWITITIPEVQDLAEAEAVAARLSVADGIGGARPAWLVVPDPPADDFREAPAPLEANGNAALGDQRFFAAWNVASLATTKVPVVVVDFFTANKPIDQLPELRFLGPKAPFIQLRNEVGELDGNHGFWVASLLGAKADGKAAIGTHPAPETTLDLRGINVLSAGDTADILLILDRNLPNDFFVLNTSLGFVPETPPDARAEAALLWREVILRHGGAFLHTSSSGNAGITDPVRSRLNSAYDAQATVGDLRTLLAGEDLEDFEEVWEEALERRPDLATIQGHTVVVGASDETGAEAGFSNRAADVRMLGTDLLGACQKKDSSCAETPLGLLLTDEGTSGSAPQAAGLAAWLRAIDPTLDAAALRLLLIEHDDGRWVDALSATLALEARGKPVRKLWVDQNRDGDFDDEDVIDIDRALTAGDREPADSQRTWPRADLNGDGRVRSDTRTALDLDGDGELGVALVTIPNVEGILEEVPLNETALSDEDILCWAAYGSLFTGDEAIRDGLILSRCQPSPTGTVTYSFHQEGETTYDEQATFVLAIGLDETLKAVSGELVGTREQPAANGNCGRSETVAATFALHLPATGTLPEATSLNYFGGVYVMGDWTVVGTAFDCTEAGPYSYTNRGGLWLDHARTPEGAYDFTYDDGYKRQTGIVVPR
ncbi:MAG: S8/S53 family peptidase [Alphaproteobacteria bacterium]|nr:S8/S53 family peptidase [Alphaproteobacteria bacterium]MCB9695748.1 S8/S53 family peptidase [Alphaproteobacteria bacterium]